MRRTRLSFKVADGKVVSSFCYAEHTDRAEEAERYTAVRRTGIRREWVSLAKLNSAPNCGLTTRHNEKVWWFLVKETIQLELEFLDVDSTQPRRATINARVHYPELRSRQRGRKGGEGGRGRERERANARRSNIHYPRWWWTCITLLENIQQLYYICQIYIKTTCAIAILRSYKQVAHQRFWLHIFKLWNTLIVYNKLNTFNLNLVIYEI